nr:UDP-N-acetylglucosamine 2-epimerase [Bradyrhizobium sp. MOS002]
MLPPLQYPDLVHLLSKAWCVVSDSGGIQEEVPTFGLHILITRDTTERPEAVEAGFGRLVGSDYDAIVDRVRELTSSNERELLAKSARSGRGMQASASQTSSARGRRLSLQQPPLAA